MIKYLLTIPMFVVGAIHIAKPEIKNTERVIQANPEIYSFSDKAYDFEKDWCKQDTSCATLAEVGFYEARDQEDIGVVAVMQVVLNRVAHKKWPSEIREVVYHKCQFSYTCDGSLKKEVKEDSQWDRMYSLAFMILVRGAYGDDFNTLTHYHTKRVNPYWKKHYKEVVVVGDHIFYQCVKDC